MIVQRSVGYCAKCGHVGIHYYQNICKECFIKYHPAGSTVKPFDIDSVGLTVKKPVVSADRTEQRVIDVSTVVLKPGNWDAEAQAKLDELLRLKAESSTTQTARVSQVVNSFFFRGIFAGEITEGIIENAAELVQALQPFLKD